ncbi:hypothetical protein [Streptomyces sp. NPDC088794]|uniref:hypothetical protein n=1 Tax=Streptomyces sp. NPDC088794 TaxID=3365902 RepID=UPI003802A831
MGSDTVMGTAERREAPGDDLGTRLKAQRGPETSDHDIPTGAREAPIAQDTEQSTQYVVGADRVAEQVQSAYQPLWIEEPAKRRRMPDPVRTSAVRAVIIIAVTLLLAMVAFFCTMAESWLAFPMVISAIVSTVVATWGALDIWVTRQVWNQRNGVVSIPSSTARTLRRERRQARRQARATERAQARIRRRGGNAGQLSHS